jgi:hypothetical protein
MGNTWVVDMSHWDYPDDEAHRFPARTLKFWGYFGSIVEATVGKSPFRLSTGIRCRRRPGKIPCRGVIESELNPGGNELHWWCSVCGDSGRISNWAGTRWDTAKTDRAMPEISFARLIERTMPEKAILQSDDKQTGYENIQGTIECDEESEGELPKIVTGDKEFKWAELGRELMTYEGFRITIKIIDSDP